MPSNRPDFAGGFPVAIAENGFRKCQKRWVNGIKAAKIVFSL